jgi:hypothetical protein
MDNNKLFDCIIIGMSDSKNFIKNIINYDSNDNQYNNNNNHLVFREVICDSYSKIKNNLKLIDDSKSLNLSMEYKKSIIDNNMNTLNYIITTLCAVYDNNLYPIHINKLFTNICSSILSSWTESYLWIRRYYENEIKLQFENFKTITNKMRMELDQFKELQLFKILNSNLDDSIDIIFGPESNKTKQNLIMFQSKINFFITILKKKQILNSEPIMKSVKKIRLLINTWTRLWNVSNVFFIDYNNKINNFHAQKNSPETLSQLMNSRFAISNGVQ